ncbi:MAG: AraC family transcriptional regulator [Tannerella sp.]|uniref:AraC family transcriptional regulator n=1 Tax=Tannerella sp. TaxID=2382127 RepID=UPI003FA1AE4E
MKQDTEEFYQKTANRIMNFVHTHLHEPLLTEQIAEELNLSQRQLSRIVYSVFGEPLSIYILRERLEKAVLYMQIQAQTLTELSEKVGYDNAQSFSKAFKKHFGIAPKTYLARLEEHLQVFRNEGNAISFPIETVDFEGLDLAYIRIADRYGASEAYRTGWKKLLQYLPDSRELNETTRFIGLSFDDPNVTAAEHCRFYACASVSNLLPARGEIGRLFLPAGRCGLYITRLLQRFAGGLQRNHGQHSLSDSFCHAL